MNTKAPERLMLIAEVAYVLGISPTKLYSSTFCERVGLERVRVGRAVRFTSTSVEAIVQRKNKLEQQ